MRSSRSMVTLVVGTTGQLATELRRCPRAARVALVEPFKLDLTKAEQLEQVLDETRPTLVVNAGAYTAVDRAENEPELALAVNARGPQTLAEWCQRHGAALIHVSTDYVFDGSKSGAYVEDDPTNPLGVYGRSKLEGERAVARSLERHLILRTSWVFSAHGQNFVKTIMRLARERPELRVVADQRGRPTSARQLATAILGLAARLAEHDDLAWGTYHVAGKGCATWHELAGAVLDELPFTDAPPPRLVAISTQDYPTPARRPPNSELDTSRFEATFQARLAPWREELRQVVRELAKLEAT